MILYISENKVNNLLDEIQIKQRIRFSSFDTIKLSLSGLETEAKVNEPSDSIGYKLRRAIKYLKKSGALKDVTLNERAFPRLNYYKCFGAMHLHKIIDRMTGLTIDYSSYTSKNALWDFDVDIDNRFFDKLIITCSARNLKFVEFTDTNCIAPNSLGEHFLSTSKSVPVELIFMITDTDEKQKILYGSPLIITC